MEKLLFSNARTALLGGSVVALLAAWVLWGEVGEAWLIVWLASALCVNAARYLHVAHVGKRGYPPRSALDHYTLGTLVSGIVWGAAGLVFFPSVSFHLQVFLAFLLGGLDAALVISYGAWLPAVFAFSVPALAPIIVLFLASGDDVSSSWASFSPSTASRFFSSGETSTRH